MSGGGLLVASRRQYSLRRSGCHLSNSIVVSDVGSEKKCLLAATTTSDVMRTISVIRSRAVVDAWHIAECEGSHCVNWRREDKGVFGMSRRTKMQQYINRWTEKGNDMAA